MRRVSVAIVAASACRQPYALQAAVSSIPRNHQRHAFITVPSPGLVAVAPHPNASRNVRASSTLPSLANDDDGATPTLPSGLPTEEELSSDPFMKQVSHAARLAPLLVEGGVEDDNNDGAGDRALADLLSVQLSHSDGIRGFFVSYLTGDGDGSSAADAAEVPAPLREAMTRVNSEELVPLACMNVIMPTAMVTMHEDPDLSASSARTATRGAKILGALLESDSSAAVRKNCAAIVQVANGEVGDEVNESKDDKVRYWSEFCGKWGYGPKQLRDIADAVSDFC